MKVKEIKYDILKVIGLFSIILAHCIINNSVLQFSVVLMILVSSYLGLKSYKDGNYFNYFKKRIYRLVFPTWIFLIIFFIVNSIFNLCNINFKILVGSFSFKGGIGFVWVIRIYLIVALLIPIYKIVKRDSFKYIISLIIIYVLYEILCHYGIFNNDIIDYFFAYIVPCYLLIDFSKIMFEASNKKLLIISFISAILTVLIGIYLYKINGTIQPIQTMKYPFRLYYLSYGICLSSLFILIMNYKKICKIFDNKIIKFISLHSLWIYLWHILLIYIVKKFKLNWIISFIIVFNISLFITYIQSLIVKRLNGKINKNIINVFNG